jgi:hypothetical protein
MDQKGSQAQSNELDILHTMTALLQIIVDTFWISIGTRYLGQTKP